MYVITIYYICFAEFWLMDWREIKIDLRQKRQIFDFAAAKAQISVDVFLNFWQFILAKIMKKIPISQRSKLWEFAGFGKSVTIFWRSGFDTIFESIFLLIFYEIIASL